jgi:hypothetical protein
LRIADCGLRNERFQVSGFRFQGKKQEKLYALYLVPCTLITDYWIGDFGLRSADLKTRSQESESRIQETNRNIRIFLIY